MTLWRPHWTYAEFPTNDLEAPKNTLGIVESIQSLESTSFEKNFPKLAGLIKNFKLRSKLLFSLENDLYRISGSVTIHTPIVDKWIARNQPDVGILAK